MTNLMIDRRGLLGAAAGAGLVLPGLALAADGPRPVARTGAGQVGGFVRGGVQVFLGVPYGAPTGGAARFLPPAPPARWQGIRDASRFGDRSPQNGLPIYAAPISGEYMSGGRHAELLAMKEPMGEDCLVLNVLTPRVDKARRPVMVYFHGGGFTTGSGATMSVADRFVSENDMVVVTVNHRLGPLGFAYLGGISPRYARGNPSVFDMVAALKWVRDNIGAFGGDPAQVTIFGESGGGAKVSLLMAMPEAKGLFRGAIIESGGFARPMPAEEATRRLQAFMKTKGLAPDDLRGLLALPASELLKLDVSGPVADGVTIPSKPWIDGPPATAAGIPLIIGHTAHEWTGQLMVADPSLRTLTWEQLPAKIAAQFRKPEAELAPAIAAYRAANPKEDAAGIFFRMQTMQMFGRAALQIMNQKAAQKPPVFFYRFQYDPGMFGLRSFHTAELPLTMRMVQQAAAEPLSRRIAGAWAAFARTGSPNGPDLPNWPAYTPQHPTAMIFDRDVIPAGPDPEAEARSQLISIIGPQVGSL